MTGPSLYDQFQREQQQGTSLYDQYQAEQPKPHDYHAEFKSGKLQQRMQGANRRDAESAAEGDAAENAGAGSGLASHLLNAAQGIPGVEAVEAAAGALGSKLTDRPMSYRESLATLRGREAENTGGRLVKTAERMVGGAATIPFLPASGAASGAILGGAEQALDADPDRGVAGRVGYGALGAAGGALAGKALDVAGPFVRSLRAKSTARNLIDRTADRAASAKEMFDASIKANQGMPLPDEAAAFLNHPDVAPIKDRLLSMDLGLKPDSPELFDAVYKTLSDQQKTAQKGLAVTDPGKPNMGRFTLSHVKALKDKFLQAATQPGERTVVKTQPIEVPVTTTRTVPSPTTAQSPHPDLRTALSDFDRLKGIAANRTEGTVEQQTARRALERHGAEHVVSPPLTGAPGPRELTETTTAPATAFWREQEAAAPPLPGYGEAVHDYATRSADMKAVERGHDALTNATSGTPVGKNVVKKSREGFSDFIAGAEPSQRSAAAEGILGHLKTEPKVQFGHVLGTKVLPLPSKELSAAPDLLRRAMDPTQANLDLLTKLGLIGATQQ